MKDEDLTGINGHLQVRDDPDKNLVARAIYILIFFVLFSFERKTQDKTKPSNAKYVHIKKYRFIKAKADHFENAIDFAWEGCPCK